MLERVNMLVLQPPSMVDVPGHWPPEVFGIQTARLVSLSLVLQCCFFFFVPFGTIIFQRSDNYAAAVIVQSPSANIAESLQYAG